MRILKRHLLLFGFSLTVLMLGLVSHANASTLFSNYTTSFNTAIAQTFMGGNSDYSYQALGESFSLTTSAAMTNLQIALGVNTGSGNVNVSLFDGQPTSPSATSLASSTIYYSSQSAIEFQSINFNANLNANQNYWIVVDPGTSSIWGLWGETDNTNKTGVSVYSNNTWTTYNYYVQGAFAINGSQIQSQNTPEPGVLATLMSMGMAGGGMFLRRLRKA